MTSAVADCLRRLELRGLDLRPWSALLTLAFIFWAGQAAGDNSPQACAALTDNQRRLACYDDIFRRSPAPAAGTAAELVTADADFGLSEAAKRARDPGKAKTEMPQSITSKVTAIGRQPAGELVVTLENGQVWTQVSVDPRATLAVGDAVTIKKASLGSHLLVTPMRYATSVRRVK
jgi:hypothetical protein